MRYFAIILSKPYINSIILVVFKSGYVASAIFYYAKRLCKKALANEKLKYGIIGT